ncbi:LacI family DNA-binding transcriptional regulator [Lactobacillus sp. Sy-1]|uniref:LacI family DNA-binding transcriptional regulator n=1 Tax=Lactobacillus sp. Sy-1 TaxID=2109645 RepID=UPI001C5823F6|nr:LacI family DNA-binding transcriptional regulator [Lactobacillus sp. Sy-1]MBW1605504.1 LacI family DNA-binding transcriptional regulator [Lactobacillus sp. Sy-1]
MDKRITIQDIANLTGLAKSTISRALNNDSKISETTRALVKKVAKDNHYHPNLVARSIATHQSRLIGIIIPAFENQFFSRILDAIQSCAANQHYQLIIATTNEQPHREIQAVKAMRNQMVAGIIIASTGKIQNYHQLIGSLPVVFIDRVVNARESNHFNSILVDNINGSYNVVNQMLANGAERIGVIANNLFQKKSNRLIGYQKALVDHNIPFDSDIVKYASQDGKDAAPLASQLLINQACDGIFATDNTILKAILRQLTTQQVANLQVGTFDDNSYLSLIGMPIIANQQPATEMGIEAFKILSNQISHPHQPVKHIKLKTTIKNYT